MSRGGQNAVDMSGRLVGRLTVIERSDTVNRRAKWLCLCECGTRLAVDGYHLRSGHTSSCGCAKRNNPGFAPSSQPGEVGFRLLFKRYNRQAAQRSLSFDLTREEFRKLVTADCSYCGAKPSQKSQNGSSERNHRHTRFFYNGVDRINNDLGYSPSNTVSCCGICNKAKSQMSYEQFREWIARVHSRFTPN